MRNATIRQLQIFAMAAKHLSFARAAEKLHLTHSAISLQIKQLEEVSGTRLFDRIGKRVFLTEGGETLLIHTRQILQLMRDAHESLMALKGLKGGRISLAVTGNAEYFAPGLLAEFRKQEAHVRLRLLVDNREEVTRLLVSNEVDLVIMGRPPAHLNVEAVSFSPHPLVLIAGAGHPLAGRDHVSIQELDGEMMIVREAGSGTRLAMETFFRERGVEPRIDMEMGSNEAIKQAVVAGLGIGFISQHILGLEFSTGRLAILKVEGTPVMRRWFLVRQKGKNLSPALCAFWDFVVKFAPDYLKRDS